MGVLWLSAIVPAGALVSRVLLLAGAIPGPVRSAMTALQQKLEALQVELGTSSMRIEVQEAVVAALKLLIDPGLPSSARMGFLQSLGQVRRLQLVDDRWAPIDLGIAANCYRMLPVSYMDSEMW